jgi:antirestriction protein
MAPCKLTNYENFDQMNEVAEILEDEEYHPAIHYLGELVSYGFFSNLLEAAEHIDDIGVYSDCYSFEDYAEQYIEELGYLQGIPDIIAWHIDYEGIGRDLSMNSNLYQADDGVILDIHY